MNLHPNLVWEKEEGKTIGEEQERQTETRKIRVDNYTREKRPGMNSMQNTKKEPLVSFLCLSLPFFWEFQGETQEPSQGRACWWRKKKREKRHWIKEKKKESRRIYIKIYFICKLEGGWRWRVQRQEFCKWTTNFKKFSLCLHLLSLSVFVLVFLSLFVSLVTHLFFLSFDFRMSLF